MVPGGPKATPPHQTKGGKIVKSMKVPKSKSDKKKQLNIKDMMAYMNVLGKKRSEVPPQPRDHALKEKKEEEVARVSPSGLDRQPR